MNKVWEYMASGILEMYVLGATDENQTKEVEMMSSLHKEVHSEILEIRHTLSSYVQSNAVDPCPTIKPFLFAIIDYLERRSNGEQEALPPLLTQDSQMQEFDAWLSRHDRVPNEFKGYYAKIIGHTPEVTTAIVWIKESISFEKQDDQVESLLIMEGTCTVTVGEESIALVPNGYFTLSPHLRNSVKATSGVPCKVIFQRVTVMTV